MNPNPYQAPCIMTFREGKSEEMFWFECVLGGGGDGYPLSLSLSLKLFFIFKMKVRSESVEDLRKFQLCKHLFGLGFVFSTIWAE